MPLSRFEIPNEYSLGAMELYRGSLYKDDPKAILDGLAVAGLVGVLRQLGDLAEFAAEIFHDLQEQVVTTASRSHKIMTRVKHMEQALPHIENVVFSQTEHIHFAYTTGSDWHPNHQIKENLFVSGDLPPFIMDSFEECRDPPSLHLLDKFDIGGPGACLKRYSDPSFFRRALSSCNGNIQEEKKTRRSNKNGLRQRNIAMPHPMAIFQQNSRMQFTSPNISQKSSTARTNSVSRSEPEDRSMSFDSRRSDYDLEFEVRSCTPDKENEHHILAPSTLEMQYVDTVGSVHPCYKNGHGTDLSQHEEERVPNSLCVTWDEKTEIFRSTSQSDNINEDQRKTSDLIPGIAEPNKLESEVVRIDDCYSDPVTFYNENMQDLHSEGNLSEDDESESENYMDALNTTASDIDTDAERQAKIGEYSETDTNNGKGTNEITSHSSTLNDVQPCMILEDQDISYFPEHLNLAKPQIVNPVDSDLSDVIHLHNVPKAKSCETSFGDSMSSGFIVPDKQTLSNGDIDSSMSNPLGSLMEPSSRSSVDIWTNGGLLGLEPSNPLVFNVLDSANQNLLPITNMDERNLERNITTPETHLSGSTRKLDRPVLTSEAEKNPRTNEVADKLPETVLPHAQDQMVRDSGNSVQKIDSYARSMSGSDKSNVIFGEKSLNSPSSLPKAELDELKASLSSANFSNECGSGLTDARVVNLGYDLPAAPNVSGSTGEINQDTKAGSSSMFLPNYELLANTFQKKASLSHDETVRSQPPRTMGTEPNEHLKYRSLINSTSSSPPLEHMKISFNPTDGYETSMKLKFHDGRHFPDNGKDVLFPSFQLLPESVIMVNDINYESDGDTFSRTSEYVSDELLSEISESNSEQWACKETPQSEDKDIYITLRRVSSAESISRSSEFEGSNSIHTDSELRSPVTGKAIPCDNGFVISPPSEKNMQMMFQMPHEPVLPSPPPLPPLQWRMTKPEGDLVDDKQDQTSEAFTYQNIERARVFDMPQQPKKAAPREQIQINESTICTPQNEKHEDWKLNGRELTDKPQSGNKIDEKEDFLHQIRSKSLSLKRTVTARPAFTSVPMADMKVTAIIQKANAIRQAFVGSDEEDSDDWSDD